MSALTTDNLERRLLSNSAKLLLLRRQPDAYKATNNVDTLMDNLIYINEQADAAGDTLLSVSSLLIQELVDEIYNRNEAPKQTVIDKAITWHEQARRYVKQPENAKIITSLISKLPLDLQGEVEDYIAKNNRESQSDNQEVFTDISIESTHEDTHANTSEESLPENPFSSVITTEDCDADDPWAQDLEFNDLGEGDSALHAQQESLGCIVAAEFEHLLPMLTGDDLCERSVHELLTVVDSLKQTCCEAKLDGLGLLCEFLNKNLALLASCTEGQKSVFIDRLLGLPDCLMAHMRDDKNDHLCLALVEYIAAPGWLLRLNYREEKNLLYAFIRQQQQGQGEDNDSYVDVTSLTQSHVSLRMSDDASPSFVDSFFVESDKQAEALATAIEKMARGNDVENNIRTAQRLAHTLKGSANLLGVQGIANFAHYLEDIFDYLISHDEAPCKDMAETMQEAADTIEVMIECLSAGEGEPEDALSILQAIIRWVNTLKSEGQLVATGLGCVDDEPKEMICAEEEGHSATFVRRISTEESVTEDIVVDATDQEVDPVMSMALTEPAVPGDEYERQKASDDEEEVQGSNEVLRVPRQLIDNILNLVGETSISLGQMQEKLVALSGFGKNIQFQDRALQSKRYELEELINIQGLSSQHKHLRTVSGSDIASGFDSLEMDEYNEFYGSAHSYIETVSDSRVVSRKVVQEVDELETLFIQQQRLNHALQDMVMSTRMIAVSTLSARLQRSVRQAGRMTGKAVALTIVGERLHVDGDLLNKLVDPIMHLLRNAVDHGIESKDLRFDRGKSEIGQITLFFIQEGNHLIVRCSDDGEGLNYQKILEKAIKKGITSKPDLTQAEIARLVLSPGFSTRDQVTQVSGRGVGMDVVNSAVVGMKGNLTVGDNTVGEPGTLIEIRLPVTLLTNHSIIVRAHQGQFAIQTNTLEQILTPGAGSLEMMGDKLCYVQEHNIYPSVTLNSLLKLEEPELDWVERAKQSPVVLIKIDAQVHAVVIDVVASAVELVIKGFGPYVGNIDGIAGVSLLGNGDIIPVIDLPQMLRKNLGVSSNQVLSETQNIRSDAISPMRSPKMLSSTVLIVDDSLSARENLAELVRDAGHTPILARDGMEALTMIQKELPDLVLTDLEMPKMNGLELTAQIRAGQNSAHIPVVMITSRSMQKHRDEAHKAGIDEYVTKPYVPEDLMDIVGERLIKAAI